MKKLILAAFLTFTLVSCQNKQSKTEDANPIEDEIPETNIKSTTLEKGCYAYDADGSAVTFEITQTDNQVLGNLIYELAEKDKNSGMFKGQLKGDTLFGVYTFKSEGIESSREVSFLIKENQLIEGYGELTDDATKFKDIENLSFTSTMPLTKVNCDK